MTLQKLMKDYVRYNEWANEQIVEWLKTKPNEKLVEYVPSSFPTIQKTLIHIWGTQRFWLSVLKQDEAPPSLSDNFNGTTETVFKNIIENSSELARYVDSLSDADIVENCTWDTPWAKAVRPKFDFIQQCVNHSTYHRGQIVTIARNVGLTDPPMTDFTAYLMSQQTY